MESSHNFLILSDLHLSEGRDPATGLIHPLEDFKYDDEFAEFIAYHASLSLDATAKAYYSKPWKLILNGDTFSFLQVVSLPTSSDELLAVKGVSNLEALTPNELRFGLGSSSDETVWKLNKIASGHPQFFQALAWFVAQNDNELVFMKGGADIELYWPEVQARIAQLLINAFDGWRLRITQGNIETPLFPHNNLPETLSLPQVQAALSFPEEIYYEPNLFYLENGCQYDPTWSFLNFRDPRLPPAPRYIHYPSGSYFMRYFFNFVKSIHPFADKMGSTLRYLLWLIRNAPFTLINFLFELMPKYLVAFRIIAYRKSYWAINRSNLTNPQLRHRGSKFEVELLQIQDQSRNNLRKIGRSTSYRLAFSVLLTIVSLLVVLWGIRLLALGLFLMMIAAFTGASLLLIMSLSLFQSLNQLATQPYLYQAAISINRLLNNSQDDIFTQVPYLIFGHDHTAAIQPIKIKANGNTTRNWYINTGSWIPVFSGESFYRQDVESLTYLRVVPDYLVEDKSDNYENVPELRYWSSETYRNRDLNLQFANEFSRRDIRLMIEKLIKQQQTTVVEKRSEDELEDMRVGSRQVMADLSGQEEGNTYNLGALHDKLLQVMYVPELKTMSMHLGIHYDDLAGEERISKARELLLFMDRKGRVEEIIVYGEKYHPNISWR